MLYIMLFYVLWSFDDFWHVLAKLEVTFMLGTSSAVAVVTSRGANSSAVTVFREDYARPKTCLVGRGYDLSSEPLASFTANQLDYA